MPLGVPEGVHFSRKLQVATAETVNTDRAISSTSTSVKGRYFLKPKAGEDFFEESERAGFDVILISFFLRGRRAGSR
jgi:hypothetical protein